MLIELDELLERLEEHFMPRYGPPTGLSAHDFAFHVGRIQGIEDIKVFIREFYDPKTPKVDPYVPSSEDRIPADRYGRAPSSSA